ncbi:MAG: glycoside hydrolase family 28 protein [Bacteroidales bacterium]|nr:glycoside hydrolase family 28 protein [Bacteroidales bacterium]
MNVFDITDFGAVGDGKTDNSKVIQRTINKCSDSGGGIVRIPGGNVFLSGPFDLKSYVNFHVESGARLVANPDPSVYTRSAFKENFKEGSIWIGGENAEKVSITGKGTIDGNGIAFMGKEEKAAFQLIPFTDIDPRPHLFTPINFNNLTIKDITFMNAAYWCIHLVGCNDVSIEGIRILNNLKIRNSDGIDPDHSTNVRINNCYIESADDCICLKTRREYQEFGPTENVTVSNCILRSTSCSIKLGSENVDAIRNIVLSNCVIQGSNRGIGIQNRDEGIIENVIFSNIVIEGRLFDDVWWGKAEPIYITAYKRENSDNKDAKWRFAEGQEEGESGKVRNILFSNILCNSENGVFVGGDHGKIKNIKFFEVQLKIDRKTTYPCGLYDLRPSSKGIISTQTAGFYILNANEVKLDNCSLNWGKNLADCFGSGIYAEDVRGLRVSHFRGAAAFPEKTQKFSLVNCEEVMIDQEDK